MPKPLRSADPNPRDTQFSHFGVLDDGQRSKSAAFISIGFNVSVLLAVIILGLVVKNNPIAAKKLAEIYLPPPAPKPPPPPPPKHPPVMPPTPKPLPTPPKITTPPPPEKLPEIVKLQPAPPKPMPPTPEVKVMAPPAPKIVNLGNPSAAHVPNNDLHPSAVSMGNTTSPVNPTGPAVSNISLGRGVPGMSGSGNGPHATTVSMGNGMPNGTNMNAHSGSVSAVKPVTIGGSVAPPSAPKVAAVTAAVASPPKVMYKPTPNYTAEARAMHLEGNVSLRIRVTAAGTVEVLNIVHGLGHGLDESARAATMATRFKPAVDGAGNPVDWEGTVVVNFQMS
jgi:periplasmic protein TonB